jgi:hypothetical protein
MKLFRVKVALVLLALLLLIVPLTTSVISAQAKAASASVETDPISINLAHLDSLSQEVTIDGKQMLIIHIYSEYPDYKWVDAPGEGIACVDDTARAVLVYLNDYRQTHNQQSLYKAEQALNFVIHMQASDGEFYNFIKQDYTINTTGSTSIKSFGWWAARAMWALGDGYSVFKEVDPAFADELKSSFLLANSALQRKIDGQYGKYTSLHGYQVPAWIDGFDAMSNALLGLTDFYQVQPLREVKDSMLKLGRGLAEFQFGSNTQYPFDAHLDWNGSITLWHAYGSGQSLALANAGMLLGKQDWIVSAKQEADQLFSHLLVTGMINQMAPTPDRDGQIAYGVDMLTQGFMAVYKATHDIKYAQDAGLAASWLTGNNDVHFSMYDPASGRGYDGLDASTGKINMNSGAESTIEALMALQTIHQNNVALKMANVKAVERNSASIYEAESFTVTAGHPQVIMPASSWTGDALYSGQVVKMSNNDQLQQQIEVAHSGEYLLYAALVKPHTVSGAIALDVRVDGRDMGAVPVHPSPDSDYLTSIQMDRSFFLMSGKHMLTVSLKTAADDSLVVDNVVLQPVQEYATFKQPDGAFFTLWHNLFA